MLILLAPVSLLAGTDEYKGDTSIYYGLPVNAQLPNVLIIVDNSRSTSNLAPVVDYLPLDVDGVIPNTYPIKAGCVKSDAKTGCYMPWDIFRIDAQGDIANLTVLTNNNYQLTSIKFTNNDDLVRKTLQKTGTYTGAGNRLYPDINSDGTAGTKNQGGVYVLGNYLNYLKSPSVGADTQRKVMYAALEKAIGSAIGSANFAAMVFGENNQGGVLIYPMTNLSEGGKVILDEEASSPAGSYCSQLENADRELCKFLASLPGSGKAKSAPVNNSNAVRSQAEAVFDGGYYFGAEYTPITLKVGTRIDAAIRNDCNFNHIILLTNGLTFQDNSPNMKIVGDADSDGWPGESSGGGIWGNGTHKLDDVANYLYNKNEIRTHTVLAFQQDDALVKNAAYDGRGNYYRASNADQLADALEELLSKLVLAADTSFVAPVVPASTTNRTISGNKVYLGLFRPQEFKPWRGNVKKYTLGPNNQLLDVDGKAATDSFGSFYEDTVSFWSRRSESDKSISSSNGDITTESEIYGDGGMVDAGGVGGRLLHRVQLLANAIRTDGWTLESDLWRKIYTIVPSELSSIPAEGIALYNDSHSFKLSNASSLAASLGVNENQARDIISFVHGFAGFTPQSDASAREWVLGDILHSRPLVMNYSRFAPSEESDCAKNNSIIFVGANDGMLHAFRDCDGSELWAFVPPDSLSTLKFIMAPRSKGGHPTFVDSPPSAYVYDQNSDGIIDRDIDRVVLLFGLRRGGGSNKPADREQGGYYGLDVTNPEQPKLLWRTGYKADHDQNELAQPWAQPRQAKIKIDDNNFKVVMFVGAGYDNNEDTRFGNNQNFPCGSATSYDFCSNTDFAPLGGTVDGLDAQRNLAKYDSVGTVSPDSRLSPRGRGIYAIEVADLKRTAPSSVYELKMEAAGSVFWSYTPRTKPPEAVSPSYSFAGDLAVLDSNNDGYADLLYAADTGGNLWRFDLSASDKGEILFRSNPGSDGTNGRKYFTRPVVAMVGGAPHIYIGSGDREHPLNMAVTDRLYGIIDWKAVKPSLTYPIDETLLEDVTANLIQQADTDPTEVQAIYERLYSRPDLPYDNSGNFRYGWYIKLDGSDRKIGGDPGEKVTAPATVFNGQVFFTTYQPKIGAVAGCDPGNLGISRLYHLDYKTGEAVYNYDQTNDLNAVDGTINERAVGGPAGELLQRTDRVRTLGEGIPSGVVTLLDASGKVTLLISSSDKVEASSLPDVKLIMPVYWMQW
jgi:type IV pilus assembly protein PilY1